MHRASVVADGALGAHRQARQIDQSRLTGEVAARRQARQHPPGQGPFLKPAKHHGRHLTGHIRQVDQRHLVDPGQG